jgi:hypothetical protein
MQIFFWQGLRSPGFSEIVILTKDPQHLVRMNIQNKFETLSLETCHRILIKTPYAL